MTAWHLIFELYQCNNTSSHKYMNKALLPFFTYLKPCLLPDWRRVVHLWLINIQNFEGHHHLVDKDVALCRLSTRLPQLYFNIFFFFCITYGIKELYFNCRKSIFSIRSFFVIDLGDIKKRNVLENTYEIGTRSWQLKKKCIGNYLWNRGLELVIWHGMMWDGWRVSIRKTVLCGP